MNTYTELLKRYCDKLSIPDINVFGNDEDACMKFIRKYFEKYGKNEGNELLRLCDKIEPGRQKHIVYTFLLGVAIYKESEFVRNRIDNELTLYDKALGNQTNGFEFVWFLICLFHDLAYPIEDEGKKCEITCYQELADRFEPYLLEELIGVPLLYQGMISRYFDYKRMMYRKPECDHGIYAGLYMYNYMCENRAKRHASNKNSIFWKPELNRVYKFVASIVACHNIWLQPKQEDVPKYIHCGMQSLMMPRGSRPIRIGDYPTFFLFCLVDSMEVAKRKKFALDKLGMNILDKGIQFDMSEFCEVDKYALRNHFFAVDDWLTDAKETEDGIITISIK